LPRCHGKGRLSGFSDPNGSSVLAYDAHGRVIAKLQGVGNGETAQSFAVSYRYQGGRRASAIPRDGR
jgi:YD repeat-containing protein